MKRDEASFVSRIPNKDPLHAYLKQMFNLSGKLRKNLGGVHYVQWGKILSGSQPNIHVTTLINKVAPALGIPLEEMNTLIAETLKRHPATRKHKQNGSRPKIQQQDKAISVNRATVPQLTCEMLPRLQKSASLRNQLSDEDKRVLLAYLLNKFLDSTRLLDDARKSWKGDSRKALKCGAGDYNYTRAIKTQFSYACFRQEPLLLAVQKLLNYVTPKTPKSDSENAIVALLLEAHEALKEDHELNDCVDRLLFIIQHGDPLSRKPNPVRANVEDTVEQAKKAWRKVITIMYPPERPRLVSNAKL